MYRLDDLIGAKRREQELAVAAGALVGEVDVSYAALLRDWDEALSAALELAHRQRNAPVRPYATAARSDVLRKLEHDCALQSEAFEQHLLRLEERIGEYHKQPDNAARLAEIRGRLRLGLGRNGDERTESSNEEADRDLALRQAQSVPIGGHTLPPLPYAYNALEPYIDERTMRIHHDKHHQSYVDGLNAAERKLMEARDAGNFDLVKHWERELAFNGAGHYLHTLFWSVMSPQGGGQPAGELLAEINRSFGGYDKFKRQFSEAANKVEGGGWAVLVWSPRSRRLEILTAEKHQNLSQWDAIPLLPLDVWEHAYYLKHQNERAAYIKDWWSVVNWPYVAERFAQARTLQWPPY